MTNFEKHKEELIKMAIASVIAIRAENGEICLCSENVDCNDCAFSGCLECSPEREKWLDEEYKEPVEPEVDWSKVPVDTPILVRYDDDDEWMKRYFAKYEYGKVYAFHGGYTSWLTGFASSWDCAKLANVEAKE